MCTCLYLSQIVFFFYHFLDCCPSVLFSSIQLCFLLLSPVFIYILLYSIVHKIEYYCFKDNFWGISHRYPNRPGTHCVPQAGLELLASSCFNFLSLGCVSSIADFQQDFGLKVYRFMDSILNLETFLFLAVLLVDWCFIWEHLNNFNSLVVLNRSVWTFVNLTGFSAVGRVMNPIIHHYVHIWPQKSNLSNSLRSTIHTYSSSKCGSHKINLSSLGVFALLCFSLVWNECHQ